MNLSGFHHITAIAADARRNRDFYEGILGLRLVKVAVNFDDPSAYHLYYGDGIGSPGTILTFFIWKDAFAGHAGIGQTIAVALSIPQSSLGYWFTRLQEKGLRPVGPLERFGEKFLIMRDPDGMTVELVAEPDDRKFDAWKEGQVPVEHAIRGIHGVTLLESGYEETANFLTDELKMTPLRSSSFAGQEGTSRFIFGSNNTSIIDLKCAPEYSTSALGTGSIHHVAFGAKDDAEQGEWLKTLSHRGHNVSPVMDRMYFRSIYFREPGGVLFEIATLRPGFTVDESRRELGSSLKLLPIMEPHRDAIVAMLPPFPGFQ